MQLIDYGHGDGLEVVFGGGRREFMRNNEYDPEHTRRRGRRQDGRNLIQEWLTQHPNSEYVWNKTAFDQMDVNKVEHVMGGPRAVYFNVLWDPLCTQCALHNLQTFNGY